MVLQDQAAPHRAGNLKRTLIYVLAFALASLAMAGGLSLALVGVAQSALPKGSSSARAAVSVVGATASEADEDEEQPKVSRRVAKPTSRRATEPRPAASKDQDEE